MTGSTTGGGARRWAEPWVVHEDTHLLVVDKPAGVNTHRADDHAQDGMYEWVGRQRIDTPLSVLHRLDKGTSGVLVFGKSATANRALTPQFEQRSVAKRYEFLTGASGGPDTARCDDPVGGRSASTDFAVVSRGAGTDRYLARPHSGRTHQVRVHAAAVGVPVAGDTEYGGNDAARLYLHAASIELDHPEGGTRSFSVEPPTSFDQHGRSSVRSPGTQARVALEARTTLLDLADTDAFLWIDRDHDGISGVRVERLGRVALLLDYRDDAGELPPRWIDALLDAGAGVDAVYRQRRPRRGEAEPARRVAGTAEPRFDVSELGVRYRIDLEASTTSSGLFLDQRETRRELLAVDRTGSSVLNAFAHTGALSVAAALAGAETLTLDLSKHYLDWARENLRANGLDPGDHDFIYGDAMDWMRRLARKGRRFDTVIVDPPTASTARKGSKRWTVDRDLGDLVGLAAELCTEGGEIYVSTNSRRMTWDRFLGHVRAGLDGARRSGAVETRTLPLDHRTGPGDPPYLKAAWIHLDGSGPLPGRGSGAGSP